MSRISNALALLVFLCSAACLAPAAPAARGGPTDRPAPPSLIPQPPPAVRLQPPDRAILADQVVGAPRRGGHDHLTAAQAASEQPDQAAALAEFTRWGWLDGASRTWTGADETLVETTRPEGAVRAFTFWAQDAPGACSPAASAGLDDCRQGVAGDRAVVVGRLASAAFRLQCPPAAAERLTIAQAAALHG